MSVNASSAPSSNGSSAPTGATGATGAQGAQGATGGDNGTNNNPTNFNSSDNSLNANQNVENGQQSNDGQNDDGLGDLFDSQQNDNNQQNTNVPENYEFLDGQGNALDLDDATKQGFTNAFKDLGLSQEQATKALGLYIADMKEVMDNAQAESAQKQKEQIAQWRNEIANDPQLGGANLQQTKQNISKVMQKFGSPELKDFLNSGSGYNPTIIRLFNAIGEQLGNDSNFINGKGGNGAQVESSYEWAKRMYPNSPDLWK